MPWMGAAKVPGPPFTAMEVSQVRVTLRGAAPVRGVAVKLRYSSAQLAT
jgi:hypothetical protein